MRRLSSRFVHRRVFLSCITIILNAPRIIVDLISIHLQFFSDKPTPTMISLSRRSILRTLLITSPLIFIGLFVSLKPSEPVEDESAASKARSETLVSQKHGNWWKGIHRGANWSPLDWAKNPMLKEEALDGDKDGWVNFDEELKWTKYEGGELSCHWFIFKI